MISANDSIILDRLVRILFNIDRLSMFMLLDTRKEIILDFYGTMSLIDRYLLVSYNLNKNLLYNKL